MKLSWLFIPLFKNRFGWYYRQRFWLRFAAAFGFGWLAFVALAVTVAMALGAYEEARPFFTLKGGLLVLGFIIVFGIEGAVIGGLIDLAKHFTEKHSGHR